MTCGWRNSGLPERFSVPTEISHERHKEFFQTWLQENVGDLPAESEVSVAVLAQQFESKPLPTLGSSSRAGFIDDMHQAASAVSASLTQ